MFKETVNMFKKNRVFFLFTVLMILLLTACGSNEQDSAEDNSNSSADSEAKLIISAAASLTDALEEIKTAFNKENPDISITYNFGGSGNLSQQIQQGAPTDIFLSASKKDMDTISEKTLIDEDSRFDFVQNQLVVITEKSNTLKLPAIEDLATIDIGNLAMGDVEAVPAGRYGKASLENSGVWDNIENKVVYFSDVRQVLTQVETGNAELGIVYRTDAIQSDKVKIIHDIDSSLHDPIIYPAAIIKDSQNKEAATKYLDFLKSEKGKEILQSYGFITN